MSKMVIHTKTSPLVWGALREANWNEKYCCKVGRSFITLEALQTLVVEIEAVLND